MSAIQSFSSPALQQLYGLPASITAYVVTGYMLFGAAGMVLGGFLVGRVERLEKVISACLLFSGVLLALVGTGWLPGYAALGVAALAGIGTGLAGPSRDMLVKRAAPPAPRAGSMAWCIRAWIWAFAWRPRCLATCWTTI